MSNEIQEKLLHELTRAETHLEAVGEKYDEVRVALEEYGEASQNYDNMKSTIESKKNQLLSTGMVTGKNAEERAANLWVAISEYDDLEELNAGLATAKTRLEVARLELSKANDLKTYYNLAIKAMTAIIGGEDE